MEDTKRQWYSNKELFEMLEGFKKEVTKLRLEMKETKTLIRDYNGLRESVNDTYKEINDIKGEINNRISEIKEDINITFI